MMIKYQVIKKLQNTNQEQLLKFYNELTKEQKNNLLRQIKNIDIKQINTLYTNSFYDEEIVMDKISPLKYIDILELSEKEKKEISLIGLNSIINNEYGVVTLAGGLGTRLGHPGPKGTFVIEIKDKKISLFELMINQLKEINLKYNIVIPWYIMTGKENNDDTIKFFVDNNYFDYPKDKITFFVQDELPVIDTKGKILLKDKGHILTSSNGNGDVFKALYNNNLIKKMKHDNTKWLLFSGIDNILVKLVDPLFLGLTIKNNYQVATKTLFKENALDKDYIFCKYSNKPFMLPYNNITEEFSNKKENNRYLFRDINTAIHLISIKELEKYSQVEMKYHRCYKKSNYLDDKGNLIKTDTNNSFKFEKYIFDIFSYADDLLLFRVEKNKEFAPIKNREGSNSPETAIKLYETCIFNKDVLK